MKKSVFSFLYIILFSICTFAQTTWVWQNPKPSGTTIRKVFFVNSTTGWVAANLGYLYKTTNGGLSFDQYKFNVETDLIGMYFVPNGSGEYTGWLSASNHTLYKTTNTGLNWTVVSDSGGGYNLWFENVNTGWSNTGRILKTTNGGANWIVTKTSTNSSIGLYFINSLTGWTSEYNWYISQYTPYCYLYYFRTTNSGVNWNLITQFNLANGYNKFTADLAFRDSLKGFSFGPDLLKTSNSGLNWLGSGTTNVISYLRGSDIGYNLKNNNILRTTNFGDNWTQVDSLSFPNLYPSVLYTYDYNQLFVGGKGGLLLRSENAGENWTDLLTKQVTNNKIIDIGIADTNTLFAIGSNNTFLRSTNSGNNWISINSKLFNGNQGNTVFFLDSERGWVGCANGKIYCTTNGGEYWFPSNSISTTPIIYIEIFGSGTGFCSSITSEPTSKLYQTTNFGMDWTLIESNSNYTIHYDFLNDATGYRVTTQVFAKTTNAGLQWNTVANSSLFYSGSCGFVFLSCADTNNLLVNMSFCFGAPAYICWNECFVSSNGGSNWTNPIEAAIVYRINNFCAFPSGNYIFTSSNNGFNWTKSERLTDNYITVIKGKDKHLWVVGDYGNIIKGVNAIPIGVDETSTPQISSYKLYQNYPNPFNPATVISFDLPFAGQVSLKIYDILGREAATLVNNNLNAGTHSIEWNASQFPSGIYFYILETNEFRESRKMVLLK